MTTQEAYEAIRAYFTRPGAVIAKQNGCCVYRTRDGNKCAVGCLIPDELYFRLPRRLEEADEDEYGDPVDVETDEAIIENETIDGILHMSEELDEIINGDSEEGQRKLNFLRCAQKLHDNFSEDASDFVVRLDAAAMGFGLAAPAYRNAGLGNWSVVVR